MNVLILGDGEEERAWAHWLLDRPEHRLDAAYPGFADPALAGIPAPRDLDDALARAGLDAVIVGGPIESRGESLRRAAAEGFAIICLHPPGLDSEAYYQVSLSREETGATIVPDLPLRLHPGVTALRQALSHGEIGTFRTCVRGDLRFDGDRPGPRRVRPRPWTWSGRSSARSRLSRPPATRRAIRPDIELVVQLRAADSRRAEVRIRSGPHGAGPAHPPRGGWFLDPGVRSSTRRTRTPDPARGRLSRRRSPSSRPGTRTRPSRGAGLFDGPPGRRRSPGSEPARRHPRHGAGRGRGPQPPPRPDRRAALRVDQRGSHVQVGHDLDRLPGLDRDRSSSCPSRWPARRSASSGRSTSPI